jgi:hypothetical protein
MVRAMSSRFYAAATLWGIALGAVAYRYGVLPFAWASPWKHVLPGLAIGLVVAGQQLVREADDTRERKRPALAVLLSLGVVGALIAFGVSYLAFPTLDRLSISKREFPGFALSLPSGDVANDNEDYAAGKLTLKNVGGVNGVVIVGWNMGEAFTDTELQAVGEIMVKALDANATSKLTKVSGPGGKPVATIVFSGDATMTLSGLVCGGRNVFVATGGKHAAMSLHERMISSFECKPTPGLEETAKMRFPLVIDLPGWYAAADERDQMQVTDGENMLVLRTQDRDLNVDMGLIAEPMFKAAGVEGKITSRQGDRVNITMADGSDSMDGWIRLVKCPSAAALVLALGNSKDNLDFLYDRVTKARCLREGEQPQRWPTPPATAPRPQ